MSIHLDGENKVFLLSQKQIIQYGQDMKYQLLDLGSNMFAIIVRLPCFHMYFYGLYSWRGKDYDCVTFV